MVNNCSAIYQHGVNNCSPIYQHGVNNCNKKRSCRRNKHISKLALRGTWFINLKLIYTLSAYGPEETQ